MKFQCYRCKGIIESNSTDNVVKCGHCDTFCNVPEEIGPGVVINDFLIEKFLGKGGMGNVYQAREFSLDRLVALKVQHSPEALSEDLENYFIKEARTVASFNHPNIVKAYKFGKEGDTLFFAMELIEGQSLQTILDENGPLEEKEIYSIAIDVATALGYAWEKDGLVHRDIKPENIMITNRGVAKIMDMGISLRASHDELTQEIISGTPLYMSPEQITGEPLDHRTDFYALGVTLFYTLTDRLVFESENICDIAKMHLIEEPPVLHKVNRNISAKLSNIVRHLLAKDKEKRFADSESLIKALKSSRKQLQQSTRSKIQLSKRKAATRTLRKSATGSLRFKRNHHKVHGLMTALISSVTLTAITFVALNKSSQHSYHMVKFKK